LKFFITGVSPERKSDVPKQELLDVIEQKRTELIHIALVNGLSSSNAIKCSQELDHLLNEYNRKYIKKVSIS
jgi:stage 0 sporulation regulatory protein